VLASFAPNATRSAVAGRSLAAAAGVEEPGTWQTNTAAATAVV